MVYEDKQKGIWVFRAYDEDGFPVKEAYQKSRLINELWDEFHEKATKFHIKRVFIDGLK